MIERKQDNCPKCGSKFKAIIGKDLVCIGIGCDYIYRCNVDKVRENDQTVKQIKEEWQ